MNILFVSESIWMQGVVYDLHMLAEGLALRGHKVYAVDPGYYADGADGAETKEVYRVFPQARVELTSPRFKHCYVGRRCVTNSGLRLVHMNYKRYRLLDEVLCRRKIDVIVLYSAARNGVQTVLLAKKYGIPVVFRNVDKLYNLWPTPASRAAVKLAERFVYPRVDKVLALTPKYADYMVGLGADRSKVELLLFPIDLEQFHPSIDCSRVRERWNLPVDTPAIVFIGALYEFGGLIEFTRRFPAVLKEVPNAKLVIVGDGPIRPNLDAIVAELKLEKSVVLTGPQPFEDMPAYVNAATVCLNVFPINERTKDIFSAKIVQYLSCGKATVSSALPGITTVIPGESCGVIYADTIEGIGDRVTALLTSPERRTSFEKAGLSYVAEAHCHKKVTGRLEEALQRALAKAQGE